MNFIIIFKYIIKFIFVIYSFLKSTYFLLKSSIFFRIILIFSISYFSGYLIYGEKFFELDQQLYKIFEPKIDFLMKKLRKFYRHYKKYYTLYNAIFLPIFIPIIVFHLQTFADHHYQREYFYVLLSIRYFLEKIFYMFPVYIDYILMIIIFYLLFKRDDYYVSDNFLLLRSYNYNFITFLKEIISFLSKLSKLMFNFINWIFGYIIFFSFIIFCLFIIYLLFHINCFLIVKISLIFEKYYYSFFVIFENHRRIFGYYLLW